MVLQLAGGNLPISLVPLLLLLRLVSSFLRITSRRIVSCRRYQRAERSRPGPARPGSARHIIVSSRMACLPLQNENGLGIDR